MDITKADWKLFQEKLPKWQEAYMGRLNKEYIELLNGGGLASEKFWELSKRIREDKHNPGVQLRIEKKETDMNIVHLILNEVISLEDLTEFSPELQTEVSKLVERFKAGPEF